MHEHDTGRPGSVSVSCVHCVVLYELCLLFVGQARPGTAVSLVRSAVPVRPLLLHWSLVIARWWSIGPVVETKRWSGAAVQVYLYVCSCSSASSAPLHTSRLKP
jgi:hypothetical protein